MRSPALRLALAGAALVAAPALSGEAQAADLGYNLHTEVRLGWTQGRGLGVGLALNPQLALNHSSGLPPTLGVSLVGTHIFGDGGDLELLGQAGAGLSPTGGCLGVSWYAPVATALAQGGVRFDDGAAVGVVGVNLGAALAARMDITRSLGTAGGWRGALGAGYPVALGPTSCSVVVEGRPLRGRGGALREAAVVAEGALGDAAAQWASRAADELAAVRAFVELADHLRAHGAPAALVQRAERAAEEELEHAALCLALAARSHGAPVAGAVPEATQRELPSLGVLAAEAHADGWVNEGEAAVGAAARAREADPVAAAVHRKIATEERAHGSFGRELDRWAQRTGGRAARRGRAAWLEAAGWR